jgi:tRNA threonylcarbamoyladenosine biosynthesis protein TsaE
MDAFRLSGEEDFIQTGGEELFYSGGVSAVEWSERIAGLIPPQAFLVEITIGENGERRVRVSSPFRRESP